MSAFAERLCEAMDARGMTQAELCRRANLGKSSVCQYLRGNYEPKRENVSRMAGALRVRQEWLESGSGPMEPVAPEPPKGFESWLPPNAYQVDSMPLLPIVGCVKAGYGGVAYEDVEGYAPVPDLRNPDEYFLLRVTGDSMEPQILEGDLAIVHRQEDVDSGDVAVCIVNGDEGTVKKVIKQGRHTLVLQAFNPAYPPRVISGPDLEDLLIAGRVVGLTRRF